MSGASKHTRSGGMEENLEFGWNNEMWLVKTIRVTGEGGRKLNCSAEDDGMDSVMNEWGI